MLKFVAGRAAQAVLAIAVATMLVFILVRLSGDPIERLMPPTATAEDVEMARQALGLDQPIVTQYLRFVGSMFVGDFGTSLVFQQPALGIVAERIPYSAVLAVVAFAITLLVAIPAGVYAAANNGRPLDKVIRGLAVMGQAMPPFWLGALLLLVFSVQLGWVPTLADPGPQTIILPAITLAVFAAAGLSRLTRSAMLEVLRTDYIRFARVKGAPDGIVLWKHGLRNASLNVLTFGALVFLNMLTGTIIVENVFAWPGVGQLTIQSVQSRDFPVLQTIALFYAVAYVVGSFVVDVLYAALDPRLRYTTS